MADDLAAHAARASDSAAICCGAPPNSSLRWGRIWPPSASCPRSSTRSARMRFSRCWRPRRTSPRHGPGRPGRSMSRRSQRCMARWCRPGALHTAWRALRVDPCIRRRSPPGRSDPVAGADRSGARHHDPARRHHRPCFPRCWAPKLPAASCWCSRTTRSCEPAAVSRPRSPRCAPKGDRSPSSIRPAPATSRAHEPIMPLPEPRPLYGNVAAQWVQNITMSADFTVSAPSPRSGGTSAPAIARTRGLCGPVTLQSALTAIGPVDVPGWGQLTATTPFTACSSSPISPSRIWRSRTPSSRTQPPAPWGAAGRFAEPGRAHHAVQQPIDDGRISVWSAHAEEQAVARGRPLAGQAARQEAAGDRRLRGLSERRDGREDGQLPRHRHRDHGRGLPPRRSARLTVAVTLTNTAPADAAPSCRRA